MLATVLRFNYEKKAKRVTAERLQVTVTTIALTVYSKTRVGKGDFFRTVEGEENFVGDSEIIALGGASNERRIITSSAKPRVCNFLWAARSRLIDVGGDSVTK